MAWFLWTLVVLNSLGVIALWFALGGLFQRVESIRQGSLLHLLATNMIRRQLEARGCLSVDPTSLTEETETPPPGDMKN
jgi:hypothetical protein